MAAESPFEPIAALADLVRLAERLQEICLGRSLTVATAESCTGGLVAHVLTEVAGSSGYFRSGVVVYSDDAKRALLDVPDEVLSAHGAVSAQVARAMAVGARDRLGVGLAVAITGIAGPDGGTAAKPVGLTYVAAADASGKALRRFQWSGDRAENKRLSAEAALELLIERASLEPVTR
jgi:nicotinamide-nucleotide amidase